MKAFIRTLIALVFATASFAHGVVPSISISVSDSAGKTAYKGVTDATGTFTTGKLQPGSYVVQFRSATAPKKSRYVLVVAAGKKKVSANGIAAERLSGAGAAMKIDVGSGLKIAVQVVAEDKNSAPIGHSGKPMVWIGPRTGSSIGAHWAESDSAEAKEVETGSSLNQKNLQDRQNQGINPQQPQTMSKTGL